MYGPGEFWKYVPGGGGINAYPGGSGFAGKTYACPGQV